MNDCGMGDTAEIEPCLVDLDEDTINGGCDSSPEVFENAAVSGETFCGTISTYDADTDGDNVPDTDQRDTDWYLVSPLQLVLTDVEGDGNGVVRVRATLESEFDGVVFIVDLGDPLCSGPAVAGRPGFSGPGCAGGNAAELTFNLADHPNSVAVFVSSGNDDGSPILDGFECATGLNDYTVTIEWEDATETPIATGPDPDVAGFLAVGPDAYGSWSATHFGGLGDRFNPNSAAQPAEAGFTAGFFLFVPSLNQRELLSDNALWQAVGGAGDDASLDREVTAPIVASDTDGDAVNDVLTSSFRVFGGTTDLGFDLTQQVTMLSSDTAKLCQIYEISNDTGTPIDFTLVRVFDGDLTWEGNFTDDSVGTSTNDSAGPRHVYMREVNDLKTRITLQSPQGASYFGGKTGIMPGGVPPAYGDGTDTQVWDAFGIPATWVNHIAGVGYDTDGQSGATPPGCTGPCDGVVGLEVPVSLDASGSTTIEFVHLYGIPSFSEPQVFEAEDEALRHAVGDLDGDLDEDVVVVLPGDGIAPGKIQVFLNQGTAGEDWQGLVPNQAITVEVEPSDVVAGQFNHLEDMDLDLAVTNAGSDTISILINTGMGDGTFEAPVSVDVGSRPSSVAVADFDPLTLEEHPDLAVSNEDDGTVLVLFGDGMGNFMDDPGGHIPVGFNPGAMRADDIDNDKCDDDVAGTAQSALGPGQPGIVFVLLGNGDGTFEPVVGYDVGVMPTDLSIADLNNDTDLDLVASNGDDGDVSILINTGFGLFDPAFDVPVGGSPRPCRSSRSRSPRGRPR
jgi:hypothetical protein